MLRTPDETSVDPNVSVAFHLSKIPSIATEASTSNLILLSTGVILKTGPCAWTRKENVANAKRQNNLNRMLGSLLYLSIYLTPTKLAWSWTISVHVVDHRAAGKEG